MFGRNQQDTNGIERSDSTDRQVQSLMFCCFQDRTALLPHTDVQKTLVCTIVGEWGCGTFLIVLCSFKCLHYLLKSDMRCVEQKTLSKADFKAELVTCGDSSVLRRRRVSVRGQ